MAVRSLLQPREATTKTSQRARHSPLVLFLPCNFICSSHSASYWWHVHTKGPSTDLDEQAAIIQLSPDNVHRVAPHVQPEGLWGCPSDLHVILDACKHPGIIKRFEQSVGSASPLPCIPMRAVSSQRVCSLHYLNLIDCCIASSCLRWGARLLWSFLHQNERRLWSEPSLCISRYVQNLNYQCKTFKHEGLAGSGER